MFDQRAMTSVVLAPVVSHLDCITVPIFPCLPYCGSLVMWSQSEVPIRVKSCLTAVLSPALLPAPPPMPLLCFLLHAKLISCPWAIFYLFPSPNSIPLISGPKEFPLATLPSCRWHIQMSLPLRSRLRPLGLKQPPSHSSKFPCFNSLHSIYLSLFVFLPLFVNFMRGIYLTCKTVELLVLLESGTLLVLN